MSTGTNGDADHSSTHRHSRCLLGSSKRTLRAVVGEWRQGQQHGKHSKVEQTHTAGSAVGHVGQRDVSEW